MKIIIGSDHAGKEQRIAITKHLSNKHEVLDIGTNEDVANYAEIGIEVAKQAVATEGSIGIVICGTGIGISIAANKVKNARCALLTSVEVAPLARQHNNANVISLGARINKLEENIKIIELFLDAEFEGGRHQDRLEIIKNK